MRRYLALLALPLVLAACDQNTAPPAAETPSAAAPAAAPAAEPAAPVSESGAAIADLDLAPITGNWAAVPANCASPVVISATSFEGAENICEITSLTDNGDGSLDAAMTCQAEGQTVAETIRMTPIFGPTGEGVRLEYVDRGGDPVNLFRCRG